MAIYLNFMALCPDPSNDAIDDLLKLSLIWPLRIIWNPKWNRKQEAILKSKLKRAPIIGVSDGIVSIRQGKSLV
jgi:hypothetical protein